MMSHFYKYLFFLLLTFATLTARAQQTSHTIIFEQLNYLVYLPEEYKTNPDKRFPLLLYLHDEDGIGNDIEKLKYRGLPGLIERGRKFPFIIISPQTSNKIWYETLLNKFLIEMKKKYRIDNDRVYLTGVGMGGYATWSFAQNYPELFSAIVPISGNGQTTMAWSLENIPVWAFDRNTLKEKDRTNMKTMMELLRKYGNSDHRYTTYRNTRSRNETKLYENKEMYKWLLSHTKFKYKEVEIHDQILIEYEGKYVSLYGDTMLLVARKNSLDYMLDKGIVYKNFKPASDYRFFASPEKFEYIIFEQAKSNGLPSLRYYHNGIEIKYERVRNRIVSLNFFEEAEDGDSDS